jgi:hypothetical protein
MLINKKTDTKKSHCNSPFKKEWQVPPFTDRAEIHQLASVSHRVKRAKQRHQRSTVCAFGVQCSVGLSSKFHPENSV